ncbi:HAMP domain-containing sensor histidine kinase [Cupriavidus sp. UYPR2.512]|uniref:sensor histidine kinase n=1 Tax=Cupriavidus sp. UYPR2.512 TaxID=1080187 RepID=UPI0003769175|nr:HAMP domain-containing histidine kinase [Cupriavidus sp. UYPR2.512]UIF86342.1 HAMP domain-containing histidine kinase [Cupriavidus necator]
MKASRLPRAGLAVALWLGGRWLARCLRGRPVGQRRADVRDPDAVHGMLLQVLGHDLRAPNASLLAWLELRRTRDQADAALLAQVGGHARRSLCQIDDLNRLLRETRHAYRMRRIAMESLLDEALDRVWTLASEAGIRFERPAGRLPRLGGDQAMLAQTLEWLLTSAIGAAARGTALRVTCRGHAGGLALWLAFDPADDESAARLAQPGPALLCAQRVVARHGGVLVPLQPMGQAAAPAGWYLWLRRRPRP